MITFKSITDVEQLRNHPLHDTLKQLVVPVIAEYTSYRPEDDGYLVLIEPSDVDRVLDDLDMPWRLSELPFEGVSMIDECFHAYPVSTGSSGPTGFVSTLSKPTIAQNRRLNRKTNSLRQSPRVI